MSKTGTEEPRKAARFDIARRAGEPGAAKAMRDGVEMWTMQFRPGYLWKREAAMWCSEWVGTRSGGVVRVPAIGRVSGWPVGEEVVLGYEDFFLWWSGCMNERKEGSGI